MQSRSRKKEVRPLASLVQTVPVARIPVPASSSLLVTPMQPRAAIAASSSSANVSMIDIAQIESELQALRQGTHPGFLRALDSLDLAQQEQVLQVHRLKEERIRHAEELFIAELQGVEDDYREEAEQLREKMMEELQNKMGPQSKTDMMTRGKRAKNVTKDERPKKRANLKGLRSSISNEEISADLEAIRAQMNGLAGGTRSNKAK